MHHAGIQYGQGTIPSNSVQYNNVPELSVPSNIPTSTAALRQWRKKEPQGMVGTIEKPGQDQTIAAAAASTSTSAPESQGPIARVAPQAHYPRPTEPYRYPPHQYTNTDYGLNCKDLSPTPVKYSEIVEPSHSSSRLDHHLSPIIQKAKEKEYLEMCSVQHTQMNNMKHAYPNMHPAMIPPPPHQYKESHMHHPSTAFTPYHIPPNYKMNQYQRQYGNESNFPLQLFNDQQFYPVEQRPYQNPHHQRMYRTQAAPSPSSYRSSVQAYGNAMQSYNYKSSSSNHHDPYSRMHGIPHTMQKYPLESRRVYPENLSNYPTPRVSPPNYPQCNQIEYAQHYQNRRHQEYLQQDLKLGYPIQGHMPDIVTENTPKPSLKQFLETWNDDIPDIQDGKSETARGKESSLYILDTTEIPTENVQQFLHLQVDKLPENIKFLGKDADADAKNQSDEADALGVKFLSDKSQNPPEGSALDLVENVKYSGNETSEGQASGVGYVQKTQASDSASSRECFRGKRTEDVALNLAENITSDKVNSAKSQSQELSTEENLRKQPDPAKYQPPILSENIRYVNSNLTKTQTEETDRTKKDQSDEMSIPKDLTFETEESALNLAQDSSTVIRNTSPKISVISETKKFLENETKKPEMEKNTVIVYNEKKELHMPQLDKPVDDLGVIEELVKSTTEFLPSDTELPDLPYIETETSGEPNTVHDDNANKYEDMNNEKCAIEEKINNPFPDETKKVDAREDQQNTSSSQIITSDNERTFIPKDDKTRLKTITIEDKHIYLKIDGVVLEIHVTDVDKTKNVNILPHTDCVINANKYIKEVEKSNEANASNENVNDEIEMQTEISENITHEENKTVPEEIKAFNFNECSENKLPTSETNEKTELINTHKNEDIGARNESSNTLQPDEDRIDVVDSSIEVQMDQVSNIERNDENLETLSALKKSEDHQNDKLEHVFEKLEVDNQIICAKDHNISETHEDNESSIPKTSNNVREETCKDSNIEDEETSAKKLTEIISEKSPSSIAEGHNGVQIENVVTSNKYDDLKGIEEEEEDKHSTDGLCKEINMESSQDSIDAKTTESNHSLNNPNGNVLEETKIGESVPIETKSQFEETITETNKTENAIIEVNKESKINEKTDISINDDPKEKQENCQSTNNLNEEIDTWDSTISTNEETKIIEETRTEIEQDVRIQKEESDVPHMKSLLSTNEDIQEHTIDKSKNHPEMKDEDITKSIGHPTNENITKTLNAEEKCTNSIIENLQGNQFTRIADKESAIDYSFCLSEDSSEDEDSNVSIINANNTKEEISRKEKMSAITNSNEEEEEAIDIESNRRSATDISISDKDEINYTSKNKEIVVSHDPEISDEDFSFPPNEETNQNIGTATDMINSEVPLNPFNENIEDVSITKGKTVHVITDKSEKKCVRFLLDDEPSIVNKSHDEKMLKDEIDTKNNDSESIKNIKMIDIGDNVSSFIEENKGVVKSDFSHEDCEKYSNVEVLSKTKKIDVNTSPIDFTNKDQRQSDETKMLKNMFIELQENDETKKNEELLDFTHNDTTHCIEGNDQDIRENIESPIRSQNVERNINKSGFHKSSEDNAKKFKSKEFKEKKKSIDSVLQRVIQMREEKILEKQNSVEECVAIDFSKQSNTQNYSESSKVSNSKKITFTHSYLKNEDDNSQKLHREFEENKRRNSVEKDTNSNSEAVGSSSPSDSESDDNTIESNLNDSGVVDSITENEIETRTSLKTTISLNPQRRNPNKKPNINIKIKLDANGETPKVCPKEESPGRSTDYEEYESDEEDIEIVHTEENKIKFLRRRNKSVSQKSNEGKPKISSHKRRKSNYNVEKSAGGFEESVASYAIESSEENRLKICRMEKKRRIKEERKVSPLKIRIKRTRHNTDNEETEESNDYDEREESKETLWKITSGEGKEEHCYDKKHEDSIYVSKTCEENKLRIIKDTRQHKGIKLIVSRSCSVNSNEDSHSKDYHVPEEIKENHSVNQKAGNDCSKKKYSLKKSKDDHLEEIHEGTTNSDESMNDDNNENNIQNDFKVQNEIVRRNLDSNCQTAKVDSSKIRSDIDTKEDNTRFQIDMDTREDDPELMNEVNTREDMSKFNDDVKSRVADNFSTTSVSIDNKVIEMSESIKDNEEMYEDDDDNNVENRETNFVKVSDNTSTNTKEKVDMVQASEEDIFSHDKPSKTYNERNNTERFNKIEVIENTQIVFGEDKHEHVDRIEDLQSCIKKIKPEERREESVIKHSLDESSNNKIVITNLCKRGLLNFEDSVENIKLEISFEESRYLYLYSLKFTGDKFLPIEDRPNYTSDERIIIEEEEALNNGESKKGVEEIENEIEETLEPACSRIFQETEGRKSINECNNGIECNPEHGPTNPEEVENNPVEIENIASARNTNFEEIENTLQELDHNPEEIGDKSKDNISKEITNKDNVDQESNSILIKSSHSVDKILEGNPTRLITEEPQEFKHDDIENINKNQANEKNLVENKMIVDVKECQNSESEDRNDLFISKQMEGVTNLIKAHEERIGTTSVIFKNTAHVLTKAECKQGKNEEHEETDKLNILEPRPEVIIALRHTNFIEKVKLVTTAGKDEEDTCTKLRSEINENIGHKSVIEVIGDVNVVKPSTVVVGKVQDVDDVNVEEPNTVAEENTQEMNMSDVNVEKSTIIENELETSKNVMDDANVDKSRINEKDVKKVQNIEEQDTYHSNETTDKKLVLHQINKTANLTDIFKKEKTNNIEIKTRNDNLPGLNEDTQYLGNKNQDEKRKMDSNKKCFKNSQNDIENTDETILSNNLLDTSADEINKNDTGGSKRQNEIVKVRGKLEENSGYEIEEKYTSELKTEEIDQIKVSDNTEENLLNNSTQNSEDSDIHIDSKSETVDAIKDNNMGLEDTTNNQNNEMKENPSYTQVFQNHETYQCEERVQDRSNNKNEFYEEINLTIEESVGETSLNDRRDHEINLQEDNEEYRKNSGTVKIEETPINKTISCQELNIKKERKQTLSSFVDNLVNDKILEDLSGASDENTDDESNKETVKCTNIDNESETNDNIEVNIETTNQLQIDLSNEDKILMSNQDNIVTSNKEEHIQTAFQEVDVSKSVENTEIIMHSELLLEDEKYESKETVKSLDNENMQPEVLAYPQELLNEELDGIEESETILLKSSVINNDVQLEENIVHEDVHLEEETVDDTNEEHLINTYDEIELTVYYDETGPSPIIPLEEAAHAFDEIYEKEENIMVIETLDHAVVNEIEICDQDEECKEEIPLAETCDRSRFMVQNDGFDEIRYLDKKLVVQLTPEDELEIASYIQKQKRASRLQKFKETNKNMRRRRRRIRFMNLTSDEDDKEDECVNICVGTGGKSNVEDEIKIKEIYEDGLKLSEGNTNPIKKGKSLKNADNQLIVNKHVGKIRFKNISEQEKIQTKKSTTPNKCKKNIEEASGGNNEFLIHKSKDGTKEKRKASTDSLEDSMTKMFMEVDEIKAEVKKKNVNKEQVPSKTLKIKNKTNNQKQMLKLKQKKNKINEETISKNILKMKKHLDKTKSIKSESSKKIKIVLKREENFTENRSLDKQKEPDSKRNKADYQKSVDKTVTYKCISQNIEENNSKNLEIKNDICKKINEESIKSKSQTLSKTRLKMNEIVKQKKIKNKEEFKHPTKQKNYKSNMEEIKDNNSGNEIVSADFKNEETNNKNLQQSSVNESEKQNINQIEGNKEKTFLHEKIYDQNESMNTTESALLKNDENDEEKKKVEVISLKHNFSIITRTKKEAPKIRTPSARNKKILDLAKPKEEIEETAIEIKPKPLKVKTKGELKIVAKPSSPVSKTILNRTAPTENKKRLSLEEYNNRKRSCSSESEKSNKSEESPKKQQRSEEIVRKQSGSLCEDNHVDEIVNYTYTQSGGCLKTIRGTDPRLRNRREVGAQIKPRATQTLCNDDDEVLDFEEESSSVWPEINNSGTSNTSLLKQSSTDKEDSFIDNDSGSSFPNTYLAKQTQQGNDEVTMENNSRSFLSNSISEPQIKVENNESLIESSSGSSLLNTPMLKPTNEENVRSLNDLEGSSSTTLLKNQINLEKKESLLEDNSASTCSNVSLVNELSEENNISLPCEEVITEDEEQNRNKCSNTIQIDNIIVDNHCTNTNNILTDLQTGTLKDQSEDNLVKDDSEEFVLTSNQSISLTEEERLLNDDNEKCVVNEEKSPTNETEETTSSDTNEEILLRNAVINSYGLNKDTLQRNTLINSSYSNNETLLRNTLINSSDPNEETLLRNALINSSDSNKETLQRNTVIHFSDSNEETSLTNTFIKSCDSNEDTLPRNASPLDFTPDTEKPAIEENKNAHIKTPEVDEISRKIDDIFTLTFKNNDELIEKYLKGDQLRPDEINRAKNALERKKIPSKRKDIIDLNDFNDRLGRTRTSRCKPKEMIIDLDELLPSTSTAKISRIDNEEDNLSFVNMPCPDKQDGFVTKLPLKDSLIYENSEEKRDVLADEDSLEPGEIASDDDSDGEEIDKIDNIEEKKEIEENGVRNATLTHNDRNNAHNQIYENRFTDVPKNITFAQIEERRKTFHATSFDLSELIPSRRMNKPPKVQKEENEESCRLSFDIGELIPNIKNKSNKNWKESTIPISMEDDEKDMVEDGSCDLRNYLTKTKILRKQQLELDEDTEESVSEVFHRHTPNTRIYRNQRRLNNKPLLCNEEDGENWTLNQGDINNEGFEGNVTERPFIPKQIRTYRISTNQPSTSYEEMNIAEKSLKRCGSELNKKCKLTKLSNDGMLSNEMDTDTSIAYKNINYSSSFCNEEIEESWESADDKVVSTAAGNIPARTGYGEGRFSKAAVVVRRGEGDSSNCLSSLPPSAKHFTFLKKRERFSNTDERPSFSSFQYASYANEECKRKHFRNQNSAFSTFNSINNKFIKKYTINEDNLNSARNKKFVHHSIVGTTENNNNEMQNTSNTNLNESRFEEVSKTISSKCVPTSRFGSSNNQQPVVASKCTPTHNFCYFNNIKCQYTLKNDGGNFFNVNQNNGFQKNHTRPFFNPNQFNGNLKNNLRPFFNFNNFSGPQKFNGGNFFNCNQINRPQRNNGGHFFNFNQNYGPPRHFIPRGFHHLNNGRQFGFIMRRKSDELMMNNPNFNGIRIRPWMPFNNNDGRRFGFIARRKSDSCLPLGVKEHVQYNQRDVHSNVYKLRKEYIDNIHCNTGKKENTVNEICNNQAIEKTSETKEKEINDVDDRYHCDEDIEDSYHCDEEIEDSYHCDEEIEDSYHCNKEIEDRTCERSSDNNNPHINDDHGVDKTKCEDLQGLQFQEKIALSKSEAEERVDTSAKNIGIMKKKNVVTYPEYDDYDTLELEIQSDEELSYGSEDISMDNHAIGNAAYYEEEGEICSDNEEYKEKNCHHEYDETDAKVEVDKSVAFKEMKEEYRIENTEIKNRETNYTNKISGSDMEETCSNKNEEINVLRENKLEETSITNTNNRILKLNNYGITVDSGFEDHIKESEDYVFIVDYKDNSTYKLNKHATNIPIKKRKFIDINSTTSQNSNKETKEETGNYGNNNNDNENVTKKYSRIPVCDEDQLDFEEDIEDYHDCNEDYEETEQNINYSVLEANTPSNESKEKVNLLQEHEKHNTCENSESSVILPGIEKQTENCNDNTFIAFSNCDRESEDYCETDSLVDKKNCNEVTVLVSSNFDGEDKDYYNKNENIIDTNIKKENVLEFSKHCDSSNNHFKETGQIAEHRNIKHADSNFSLIKTPKKRKFCTAIAGKNIQNYEDNKIDYNKKYLSNPEFDVNINNGESSLHKNKVINPNALNPNKLSCEEIETCKTVIYNQINKQALESEYNIIEKLNNEIEGTKETLESNYKRELIVIKNEENKNALGHSSQPYIVNEEFKETNHSSRLEYKTRSVAEKVKKQEIMISSNRALNKISLKNNFKGKGTKTSVANRVCLNTRKLIGGIGNKVQAKNMLNQGNLKKISGSLKGRVRLKNRGLRSGTCSVMPARRRWVRKNAVFTENPEEVDCNIIEAESKEDIPKLDIKKNDAVEDNEASSSAGCKDLDDLVVRMK